MSKLGTLISHLTHGYRDARRCRWWLRGTELEPVAQAVVDAALRLPQETPATVDVLKQNDRKIVLRVHNRNGSPASMIAKVFFLRKVGHRLKYRRFAVDEGANLLVAAWKGIPVPELFGYGHIRGRLGIVQANMILMEDLVGCVDAGTLLAQHEDDPQSCAALLLRTIPVFESLYRACCNHIDVNGGAIMLPTDPHEGTARVIDFQHALFLKSPSNEVLMAEAGRFVGSLEGQVPGTALSMWLEALLDAVRIAAPEERGRLRARFEFYRGADLYRRERKQIGTRS